ncbi:MAG: TIGR03960 family B12-binding radical SAM protein [Candidatus Omnitrophota bacterium]
MIEDLFLGVHKPAQYMGAEFNVANKNFHNCSVSVALGFPDLYEVGMSNLGLRILYGLINDLEDFACERFFAPEVDMEAALRISNQQLFSLETKRPLNTFDFLGFSLGSELNYTNVLNILDLAGLPLESALRDHQHPLVIGGGPSVLNPEPIADFFDLFIIGEAEEAMVELLNLYKDLKVDYKSGKLSKEKLLIELTKIPGVYVPSLYVVEYNAAGDLITFAPKVKGIPLKIKKRIVGDFNAAYFPCNWMVPFIATIHDRITLEIMRGCPNRCRFCQARSQYYPFRIRNKKNVVNLANLAYASSGYEELSLAGLSVSDYPDLEELVSELTGIFKEDCVNLSLPSLKAKALLGNVSALIAKIKKTGLTFAPEAGTERLRQALAKDFSEPDYFKAIDAAYQAGYQHLKLYFLIGLPGETNADLEGIIDFANKSSEAKRKPGAGPAQINVSINPLIPKPHTPLQWLKMETITAIQEKQSYLRSHCKNRRIKFNFHNFQMGFLEGVLSRGDRKLAKVILHVYKKGAKFDAWSDHFSFSKWMEAFTQEGVDPQIYLNEKPTTAILPWDFIDMGIEKNDLLTEYVKYQDSLDNKTIAR